MKYLTQLSLLCIVSLSGCASLTSSPMQTISVSTENEKGEAIKEAKCSLKNERGAWHVSTPNTVSVRKASGNLVIECRKKGYSTGNLQAVSRASPAMYGNLFLGGPIGAAIDHGTGKAYLYPTSLPVIMGRSVTIDRRTAK